MDRRLSAILAADIVGYSALMARDEVATLEALRRLRREIFHPSVAGHRGKVVKAMGDGWLVEFTSAIDAVNAAVVVQAGLERDETIRLRIGIHLGDITHEDEDIYGDGVNVAARLEALADPGAVVISDAVYGSLDGTMTPAFEDGGERRLKNIPRPLRIWQRQAAGTDNAAIRPVRTDDPRAYKVQIGIEPFQTGDDRREVRELAAALTGDLSRCLAEGRWYQGVVSERPREGAYRLTGNLRARGDRLRLEVAVRAPDGGEIWADKIDGSLDDIFDWQDDTAIRVAANGTTVIGDIERRRLDQLGDDAMSVAELVRRAQLWDATDAVEMKLLFRLLTTAMERDDCWVTPFLLAAFYAGAMKLAGMAERLDVTDDKVREWVERAEALAAGTADSRAMLAYLRFRDGIDRDLGRFQAVITEVLRQQPHHQQALFNAGFVHMWAGDAESVVGYFTRLEAIDGSGLVRAMLAFGLVMGDRANEALEHARKGIALAPDSPWTLRTLAGALAATGRIDEAREVIDKLLRLYPNITVTSLLRAAPWSDNAATRRYFDALRAAGLPEGDE